MAVDFLSFIDKYEDKINKICAYTVKKYSNNRLEFDDLKSEAILKLLELWDICPDSDLFKSGKSLTVIIQRHLIDYVRKFYTDSIAMSGFIGL